MSTVEPLLKKLSRDLSILTKDEILAAWGDDEQAAIADIARRSGTENPFDSILDHNPIYYLAQKVFFSRVLDNPRFLYAPFHRDLICKAVLEHALQVGKRRRSGFLLLAQRNSFKSTFMHGVVPLWAALRWKELHGKNARILLLHQKELQASSNLVRLKGKTRHPWMRDTWDEFCSEKDFGDKTKFFWPWVADSGASEPSVLAGGLGQDLTGFHFDFQFLSDLVTREDVKSPIVRKNTEDCFEALGYTMDDDDAGPVFLDGTRYHKRDLYGKLMELKVRGKNAYETIVTGAGGEHTSTPLTLPFRHSQEYLNRRREQEIGKTGRDLMYWLQMQNQVKNVFTAATSPEWLKRCRISDVPEETWRCITVDPAWKGMPNHGKGDYASIQVWAFEKRGSLVLQYLIDGVHSNMMTDDDGKHEIFRLMALHGVIDVAPEERGGHAFRQSLRNMGVSRGTFINVIDLKTMNVGKPQRISALIGKIQAGTVFICEECEPDLKSAFETEFNDYPQLDHDDALDAAAYTCDPAIQEAYVPRFPSPVAKWRLAQQAVRTEVPRTRYCGL